jgi:hypothetical protein
MFGEKKIRQNSLFSNCGRPEKLISGLESKEVVQKLKFSGNFLICYEQNLVKKRQKRCFQTASKPSGFSLTAQRTALEEGGGLFFWPVMDGESLDIKDECLLGSLLDAHFRPSIRVARQYHRISRRGLF